jgi:hypothetical protein
LRLPRARRIGGQIDAVDYIRRDGLNLLAANHDDIGRWRGKDGAALNIDWLGVTKAREEQRTY